MKWFNKEKEMFENSIEIMAIAKIRENEIYREILQIKRAEKLRKIRKNNTFHYLLLENLGKLISSLGDSLQSHYHYEPEKDMRKVS